MYSSSFHSITIHDTIYFYNYKSFNVSMNTNIILISTIFNTEYFITLHYKRDKITTIIMHQSCLPPTRIMSAFYWTL